MVNLITKKFVQESPVMSFSQITMFSDFVCLYSIIKFFPLETQQKTVLSYELLRDKIQQAKIPDGFRQVFTVKTQQNPVWKAMSLDDHQRPVLAFLLQLFSFVKTHPQDYASAMIGELVAKKDLRQIENILKELKHEETR